MSGELVLIQKLEQWNYGFQVIRVMILDVRDKIDYV